MGFKDRILASLAYIFGIPSLYIVLTEYRKKEYVGYHGAQALILWVAFFVIFFAFRFIINLIWSMRYIPHLEKAEVIAAIIMGCYAFYCGYRCLQGKIFTIPR